MADLFTMKTNLTRKRHIRSSQTLKNCITRFQKVYCGQEGQIRCADLSGYVLMTELEQKTQEILGCDWRGAISLYFYLHGDSPLLSNDSKFYFMLSDSEHKLIKTSRQTVFLAMFHHLHNHLMLTSPTETPPFQTPIQEKYDYMRSILTDDICKEGFIDINLRGLEKLLTTIQDAVHFKAYGNWEEFRSIFDSPWLSYTSYTDQERLNRLDELVEDPEQLLDFLAAPLEDFFTPTLVPCGYHAKLDAVLNLVLQKLDCQEIITLTGVKPKELNWLQELDFILKGSRK